MLDKQLLAFTVTVALLTITPGSDTMLVLRSVLTRGQIAGFITTVGVCTGLFIHATLSALGISTILTQSAVAFEVVKFVGACYLIILGIVTVVHALRRHHSTPHHNNQTHRTPRPTWTWHQSFTEGLLNNILNPKPAVFYLAFLPQFIRPTDPVLARSLFLAGIHFALGVVWLSTLVLFLGKLGRVITQSALRQKLEIATGAILVGFGVRLVFERR